MSDDDSCLFRSFVLIPVELAAQHVAESRLRPARVATLLRVRPYRVVLAREHPWSASVSHIALLNSLTGFGDQIRGVPTKIAS